MKTFFGVSATIILLLLTPAIVGLVDIWCWTMLGHSASGIDWNEPRVVASIMMAALAGFAFLVSCAIVSNLERGVDLHVK
jgi:uncharacterized sodium:solute symporter family permease YidK